MTAISAFDHHGSISTMSHPLALEVVLYKQTYILPWTQFLYAEGGNDQFRLTFSTHDVLVRGSNLDSLIAAIAANSITKLEEAGRSDRMLAGTSAIIREIDVRKVDQERA
jgi:hypothetical protein